MLTPIFCIQIVLTTMNTFCIFQSSAANIVVAGMKIELKVDGKTTAECSDESQFLAFNAAVFSALSDMQLALETERRARAKAKMASFNEKLFKKVPTGHN
ncbi:MULTISPECIES: hypothetical protein [Enterobacter cloacae complex]|nr:MULTISPECIES: hypothetical protein [Enterobacter cloacae complex]MCH1622523.1 hypothetical protein [Enterobacter hormaechei]MCH1632666.1 hypothetical protein [Enterobacter hormaechei]MDS6617330.1 hypothetical protein [Enterobacter hormaechei]MDS6635799.1 hypothetical protein [Enterobacter hormaechei]MDS6639946.1 hypothetical protein [Enterobacter hormaechei]